MTATATVRVVTPTGKLIVPEAGQKSEPDVAVPPAVE